LFTIVGGNMKYVDMMRKNIESCPITCSECGEKEEMNPGDAHYQLIFEGRVLCSRCLDIENKELFYGKEET